MSTFLGVSSSSKVMSRGGGQDVAIASFSDVELKFTLLMSLCLR